MYPAVRSFVESSAAASQWLTYERLHSCKWETEKEERSSINVPGLKTKEIFRVGCLLLEMQVLQRDSGSHAGLEIKIGAA